MSSARIHCLGLGVFVHGPNSLAYIMSKLCQLARVSEIFAKRSHIWLPTSDSNTQVPDFSTCKQKSVSVKPDGGVFCVPFSFSSTSSTILGFNNQPPAVFLLLWMIAVVSAPRELSLAICRGSRSSPILRIVELVIKNSYAIICRGWNYRATALRTREYDFFFFLKTRPGTVKSVSGAILPFLP